MDEQKLEKKLEELLQTERSILSRLWSIDVWVTIIGIVFLITLVVMLFGFFT